LRCFPALRYGDTEDVEEVEKICKVDWRCQAPPGG
jgi:hypothetical protein